MDIHELIQQINKERQEEAELEEFRVNINNILKYTNIVYESALENNFDEDGAIELAIDFFNNYITNK